MTDQRIILANGSRLVREMLKRILAKTDHLKVIKEITDQKELPSALEQYNAEWIIMQTTMSGGMPGWIEKYMARHPYVRILTVALDDNKVKVRWLENLEEDLNDLSLKELIRILENNPNLA